MDRGEILGKINAIAREVFDNEDVVLTEKTTSGDVEEWDSLSHLELVAEIESEFGVKLTLEEISHSENVGAFIDALMRRMDEKNQGARR